MNNIVKQNWNCTMQLKSKDWVGLSDDEVIQIYISDPAIASYDDPQLIKYARAIEQALRNKNEL